jgi:hypothetical protein
MRPDPESLDLIRELLQSLALVTGTLTEIEMLYEVPDAKFWEVAPLIRPDVVSYFAWMVKCGAVGKISVFCMAIKYWWTYKEKLEEIPGADLKMTPWAVLPQMTEQHPTKKLKRARYITYDIARDGRAILAYLRACEARQVELMINPPVDHDTEIAEIYFNSVMQWKGLSALDAAKYIAETWQDEPEYYPENAIKQAKEIGIDIKSVKIPEMSQEWKAAFNKAYLKFKTGV